MLFRGVLGVIVLRAIMIGDCIRLHQVAASVLGAGAQERRWVTDGADEIRRRRFALGARLKGDLMAGARAQLIVTNLV